MVGMVGLEDSMVELEGMGVDNMVGLEDMQGMDKNMQVMVSGNKMTLVHSKMVELHYNMLLGPLS